MAEIRLSNVTMEYKEGVKALDDVSIDIIDHEFLVLLGPSGCGKSTMLRIISGLVRPTEGDVYFDGENVDKKDARERNVSMVFQTYALYPHLNVFKNIAFPLESMKMKKDEIKKKVEETAQILEIEHLLNRRPRELSGGQKQRVALGRAMVRDPSVFLFDEPLSNLDVKMRYELRTVIQSLHERLKTTFVYVTHDQSEAMQLGDRIAVMEEGVIRQIGKPQDVYNNPNCLYVAGFVGSPKMNFFAARFVKKETNWAVKIMGNIVDIPVERLPLNTPCITDNGKVVAGIRPEDFKHLTDPDDMAGLPVTHFAANVQKVVPMGAGLHIEMSTSGTNYMAVFLNHTSVNPGTDLELTVNTELIHLFDPDTGLALCRPIDRKEIKA